MTNSIESISPSVLNVDSLVGQHTLLIGAPSTGKSQIIRDSSIADTRVTRLDTALGVRDDEFVVLDDFYTAYQGATKTQQREFESWLGREAGVCVIARPRDIDWLLCSDDTILSASFLDVFDEVCHLRYEPDNRSDREEAVECCLSILQETSGQLPDHDTIEEELDILCKTTEYEYDHSTLQDLTSEYGETLVPGLVVYFSDQLADGNGAILPADIKSISNDILKNASFSTFFKETKEACTRILSRETLSELRSIISEIKSDPQSAGTELLTATSSLGISGLGTAFGPAGFLAGGSLALYLHLYEDNEQTLSREEVFGSLLSDELTPIARTELETELDLPPRTIRNFRQLTNSGTVEQLLQHREQLNSELGDIEERLNQIETATRRYDEDMHRISEMLSTLDDAAVDHREFASYIATSITKATADIDDFRNTVRTEETDNVLQIGSLDRVPPYLGNEDEEIVESVTKSNKDLIVLRGSHGTGKTNASYRACEILDNRGYNIVLPNFTRSSPEAIEYSLTSSSSEVVVFASFRRGISGDNSIQDTPQFRQLLTWLDEGYCSAVLLECRSELYPALDSLKGGIPDRGLKSIWRSAQEIEFEQLSDDDISEIAGWTLDQFSATSDREMIVEQVTDLAKGNPEIAKIAARFALTEDEPLKDITSYDELIWNDIDNIILQETINVNGYPVGGKSFELVSAFRQITTDELLNIIEGPTKRKDLTKVANYLSGYLGGDVAEEVLSQTDESTGLDPNDSGRELKNEDVWTIVPDIYAEVVFREGCLRGTILDRRLTDYLDDVEVAGNEQLYEGIAANLALAYQHANSIDDRELQKTTTRKCHKFLKELIESDVQPSRYVQCLSTFASSRIPILSEYFGIDIPYIISGFKRHEQTSETGPNAPTLLLNKFASLYSNHLNFGNDEQLDDLDDVARQIAAEYGSLQTREPGHVLESVYSMAITKTAQYHPDPSGVNAWIDEIEDRAHRMAVEDCHSLSPDRFLANVYSMVITGLVEQYTKPADASEWIDEIERRTLQAVTNNTYTLTPSEFLENVYAMVISNLANDYTNPAELSEWLNEIESRAYRMSTNNVHEEAPVWFLAGIYPKAIASIINNYSKPSEASEWLDELEIRVCQMATDDFHEQLPRRLLVYIYSEIVKNLIGDYSEPDEISEWLDEIGVRACQMATSDVHKVHPGWFLQNIYSTTISKLADQYPDPAEINEWLNELEHRACQMSVSDTHDVSSGWFLVNVCSRTISDLAQDHPEPTEISIWISEIEHWARRIADADFHNMSPFKFLANIYSVSITMLTEHHSEPAEISVWINEIERCARRMAADNSHGAPPSEFLVNVYSTAISSLTQSHPNPAKVSAWINEIEHRANLMAAADIHQITTDVFLENVYSKMISSLVRKHPNPKTVSVWIDEIEQRICRVAGDNCNDLIAERFITRTMAMAIGDILKEPHPAPLYWYFHLVKDVISELDVDFLPRFCKEHRQMLTHDNRPFPEMNLDLVMVVLKLTTEDWPRNDENKVTRVSTVLASMIHLIWQETSLSGVYFKEFIAEFERFGVEHTDFYEKLLEEVPKRLDVNHSNLAAAMVWRENFSNTI